MIFNRSNVKLIHENGYLSKYVDKTAPYFPFTLEDCKDNFIILQDDSYKNGMYFLLESSSAYLNKLYFICFSGGSATKLTFNFNDKTISSLTFHFDGGASV